MDGKVGDGLKLEKKKRQFFLVLKSCVENITNNVMWYDMFLLVGYEHFVY